MSDADMPALDKVYIVRDDFLREFGKYMRHTLIEEMQSAANAVAVLKPMLKRRIEDGDIIGAIETQKMIAMQEAYYDAYNRSMGMLITSAQGLGIQPEELDL